MAKKNPFTKEYYTGRKDQYVEEYALFGKRVEGANAMEDLFNMLEEKLRFSISGGAPEGG